MRDNAPVIMAESLMAESLILGSGSPIRENATVIMAGSLMAESLILAHQIK